MDTTSSQSFDSSSLSARDYTVQEEKAATPAADYRETQQIREENKFSYPSVQRSYMNSDDLATSVPGSLVAMDFINDVSVAGNDASVAGSQASIDAGFDTLWRQFCWQSLVETTSK